MEKEKMIQELAKLVGKEDVLTSEMHYPALRIRCVAEPGEGPTAS